MNEARVDPCKEVESAREREDREGSEQRNYPKNTTITNINTEKIGGKKIKGECLFNLWLIPVVLEGHAGEPFEQVPLVVGCRF